MKAEPAKAKCDEFGTDALCAALADGQSLTSLAAEIGVSIGTLLAWVADDDDRSARAREARTLAARLWDEKAERGIAEASDPFELARAKELAHHYRWRSSKHAPKDYGDKLELAGDPKNPLAIAPPVFNISLKD